MNFRKYLIITIVFVLLLFGPIDYSWPAYLAIRLGYIILIPLSIWYLLKWIWNKWKPSIKLEQIMNRILSIIIGTSLIVIAIFEAKMDIHADDEGNVIEGPDMSTVILSILFALFFLVIGIFYKNDTHN